MRRMCRSRMSSDQFENRNPFQFQTEQQQQSQQGADTHVREFVQIDSTAVTLYSDCDFMKEEFFFVIPRTDSSFESLLSFGTVNENLEEDSVMIRVDIAKLFPKSSQMKVLEKLFLSSGLFKLKMGVLNDDLLKLWLLKNYFESAENSDNQLNSQDEIEDLIQKIQATSTKLQVPAKRDYLMMLETILVKRGQRGKLSDDWKSMSEFRFRKQDSRERLEKSCKTIRFYSSRLIESHVFLLSKQLIYHNAIDGLQQFRSS